MRHCETLLSIPPQKLHRLAALQLHATHHVTRRPLCAPGRAAEPRRVVSGGSAALHQGLELLLPGGLQLCGGAGASAPCVFAGAGELHFAGRATFWSSLVRALGGASLGAQRAQGSQGSQGWADQVLFRPVMLFYGFVLGGLLSGKSRAEVRRNVRENLVQVLVASWKVWPAAVLFTQRPPS
eukprot:s3619_g3.t2